MKNNYQWQGEPVKVEFGLSIVKENSEKPLWWYNFECNDSFPKGRAAIPAIRITTNNDYSFILSNHSGIGVHKLINGGWPNYAHFSLPDDGFTKGGFKITEFDELEYCRHEADRNKWQKENYPEEYKQVESLRKII